MGKISGLERDRIGGARVPLAVCASAALVAVLGLEASPAVAQGSALRVSDDSSRVVLARNSPRLTHSRSRAARDSDGHQGSKPPAGKAAAREAKVAARETKAAAAAEAAKIKRPLFAVISIANQHISIYNHDGLVVRSGISTGVAGHPTPKGIFTIIGRERYHSSNIYSGAPMPFMQRVTWSGIAMHVGVVPGYPASHGCIRLPAGFAAQLWGMTKIGERVVISREEVEPTEFAHPQLPTPKMRTLTAAKDTAAKDTVATDAAPATGSMEAQAAVAQPALLNPHQYAVQMKAKAAADAAAVAKAVKAGLAAAGARQPEAALLAADLKAAEAAHALAQAKADAAAKAYEAAAAAAKPPESALTVLAAAKPPESALTVLASAKQPDATSAVVVVAAKQPEAALTVLASAKPPEAALAAAELKVAEAARALAQAKADAAKDAAAAAKTSAGAALAEASAKLETAKKASAAKASELADAVRRGNEAGAASDAAANAMREATRRMSPVSILVSKKDQRIYVRQGLAPIFDAPASVRDPGTPLGSHLYIATAAKEDGASLKWTVLSMPAQPIEQPGRRKKKKGSGEDPAEAPIPMLQTTPSPAEALDRVEIAKDVRERIEELLWTGGSLIVSDQPPSSETGAVGTDLTVKLR